MHFQWKALAATQVCSNEIVLLDRQGLKAWCDDRLKLSQIRAGKFKWNIEN